MSVLHIIAPKIFQIMIFCDSWTKIKLNVDYSYSAYIEALSRYVYTESQTNLRFTCIIFRGTMRSIYLHFHNVFCTNVHESLEYKFEFKK